MTTVLAVAAASWGVVMALSPALQIRTMIRHRSSRDVSLAYFGLLMVGFVLWVAYGVAIENVALVVPNACALLVGGATMIVALRYRPRRGGGSRG